ncbi:MAG: hypothetical protein RJB61_1636 [Actinomycetota bacterium]
MPWRNGGGVTRQLHVEGGDPFDWRLSAATIAHDGPFSSFPDIDRILVLLQGDGVRLRFDDDGSHVVLDRPGAACAFAGERAVDAELLGGPTVDLNLMWRRDRYSAAVQHDPADASADLTVVHVVAGTASVRVAGNADPILLGAGDSAWWEQCDEIGAVADGAAMVVCFALTRC